MAVWRKISVLISDHTALSLQNSFLKTWWKMLSKQRGLQLREENVLIFVLPTENPRYQQALVINDWLLLVWITKWKWFLYFLDVQIFLDCSSISSFKYTGKVPYSLRCDGIFWTYLFKHRNRSLYHSVCFGFCWNLLYVTRWYYYWFVREAIWLKIVECEIAKLFNRLSTTSSSSTLGS